MSIADTLLPEFDQEMATTAACRNAFRPTADEKMPGLSPA